MWKSAYVGVYQLLNWKMHGETLKLQVSSLVGTWFCVTKHVCVCVCVCVCARARARHFGIKTHPTFKGDFQQTKSASKYISLSVKFTTFLVRPLFLRGKLCFRDSRRVKNNISNLRLSLVWCSYITFIIIIGWILVLFMYITRLASNEIFSPSNKIHRQVGRAKDLSAPRYALAVCVCVCVCVWVCSPLMGSRKSSECLEFR